MPVNMKSIILILLLNLIVIIPGKSQNDLPYKPFSEFNNDTTAFIAYNYMDRADTYYNKTIEDVLKDLHISVTNYQYTLGKKMKIYLVLYLSSEKNSLSDTHIYINTIEELPKSSFSQEKWNNNIYETIKHLRINLIGVSFSKDSKFYEKYYEHAKSRASSEVDIIFDDSAIFHKVPDIFPEK